MNYIQFIKKYKNNIDYILNIIDVNLKKKKIIYSNKDGLYEYILKYIYNNSDNTIKDLTFNNIIGSLEKYDYYKLDNIEFFEDLHSFIKNKFDDGYFMLYTNSSEFAMIILYYTYIIEKIESDTDEDEDYVTDNTYKI